MVTDRSRESRPLVDALFLRVVAHFSISQSLCHIHRITCKNTQLYWHGGQNSIGMAFFPLSMFPRGIFRNYSRFVIAWVKTCRLRFAFRLQKTTAICSACLSLKLWASWLGNQHLRQSTMHSSLVFNLLKMCNRTSSSICPTTQTRQYDTLWECLVWDCCFQSSGFLTFLRLPKVVQMSVSCCAFPYKVLLLSTVPGRSNKFLIFVKAGHWKTWALQAEAQDPVLLVDFLKTFVRNVCLVW